MVVCAVSTAFVVAPIGKPAAPIPSGASIRLVVIMAYHLRHEADLAGLAASRMTAGPDSDFATMAQSVAMQAGVLAGQLDRQLGQWGISAAEAAVLRNASADPVTVSTPVHLACSLQGPVTDIDQLRAADSDAVMSVFAAFALTDAVEGAKLVEAVQAGLDGQTASLAGHTVGWHRLTVRRLSPYLLATDRAFAATFNG